MIKKCCLNCAYYKLHNIYDEECIDYDYCELYESQTPYIPEEENDCRDFSIKEEGYHEVYNMW